MNNIAKNMKEIVLVTIAAAAFMVNAAPLAGTGAYDDPFQVTSAEDLVEFAKGVNDRGEYNGEDVYVVLTDDIDMTDVEFPGIGTEDCGFCGTLDGRGHIISNLSIVRMGEAYGIGFINFLGKYMGDGPSLPGMIRDLGFYNFSVTAADYCSSAIGLVGLCDAGCIEGVCIGGRVKIVGSDDMGVFVGWSDVVEINYCTVTADPGSSISGLGPVGGYVGMAVSRCSIRECRMSGITVYGQDEYGAHVGCRICFPEIWRSPFEGEVKLYLNEDLINDACDYAAWLGETSKNCAGFKTGNFNREKLAAWMYTCGAMTEEDFTETDNIFMAFAFNLPFDTFANATPSLVLEFNPDVPELGWTTIVFHVKAGGTELDVADINANVFLKCGNSPDSLKEYLFPEEQIDTLTTEDGHTRVALVIPPPEGKSGFFKVAIR